MKRVKGLMSFLLVAVLLMSTVFNGSLVFANNDISVEIDGMRVNFSDQQPVIVDGRTLVPVRGVFETLGYTVGWEQSTQTATLSNGINTVIITIGDSTFTTNGKIYNLDVPAQIINGRTMLPLRAVLESVGYNLGWDGANKIVKIASTSTMVYYDEFPTVPDFGWVAREHMNIAHTREYISQEVAVSWSGNASVSYIYDISGTLDDDFQNRFHSFDEPDKTFFTDYKAMKMLNLYIQTLLEEGFTRTNPQDFRGISRFQAGYAFIPESFQKGNVSMMIWFVVNGHGTPPHIEIVFDMGFTQTAQPTHTEMVYYPDFPTVPDFSHVVKDYHVIPTQNISKTGDNEWWYDTKGYGYALKDYFLKKKPTLSLSSVDFSDGSQYGHDGMTLRTYLSDVENLYNTYISALLADGFIMLTETEAIYPHSTGSYDKFVGNLPMLDWGSFVVKEFQKNNVIVDVVYSFSVPMNPPKTLDRVSCGVMIFISEKNETQTTPTTLSGSVWLDEWEFGGEKGQTYYEFIGNEFAMHSLRNGQTSHFYVGIYHINDDLSVNFFFNHVTVVGEDAIYLNEYNRTPMDDATGDIRDFLITQSTNGEWLFGSSDWSGSTVYKKVSSMPETNWPSGLPFKNE